MGSPCGSAQTRLPPSLPPALPDAARSVRLQSGGNGDPAAPRAAARPAHTPRAVPQGHFPSGLPAPPGSHASVPRQPAPGTTAAAPQVRERGQGSLPVSLPGQERVAPSPREPQPTRRSHFSLVAPPPGVGTLWQPSPMERRDGGSGSGAHSREAPRARSAAAAMPGAAERGSDLSEQIEAFVARLRGGGERPRSEDTARQTLSLLRKIVGHGRWSRAGEGRAAGAGPAEAAGGRSASRAAGGAARGQWRLEAIRPCSCRARRSGGGGSSGAGAAGALPAAVGASGFPVLVVLPVSPLKCAVLTGVAAGGAAQCPLRCVRPSAGRPSSAWFLLPLKRFAAFFKFRVCVASRSL